MECHGYNMSGASVPTLSEALEEAQEIEADTLRGQVAYDVRAAVNGQFTSTIHENHFLGFGERDSCLLSMGLDVSYKPQPYNNGYYYRTVTLPKVP